jgi:hypothetical protein
MRSASSDAALFTIATLMVLFGCDRRSPGPGGGSEPEPERTARGAAQRFPRGVPSHDPAVAARIGCVPGTYRCVSDKLEVCDVEQSGWARANVCQTSAHCNAALGQCLVDPCVLGEHQCNGAVLEQCHGNGWTRANDCGTPEKCNANAGRCD